MHPSDQRAVCLILGVLCVLLTSCQRQAAEIPFTDGELDETRIATILADAKKILE